MAGRKTGRPKGSRGVRLSDRLRAMREALEWRDDVNLPGDPKVGLFLALLRKDPVTFQREWKEEEARHEAEKEKVRRAWLAAEGGGEVVVEEKKEAWLVGDKGAEAALGLCGKLLKEFRGEQGLD